MEQMRAHGLQSAVVVSNRYHLLRASILAKRLGLDANSLKSSSHSTFVRRSRDLRESWPEFHTLWFLFTKLRQRHKGDN